jgi:hypothetical protein
MRWVLAANGIVDIGCAIILLVLPLLRVPLLGYRVFDSQGAYMAAGWGVAALSFGLARLLAAGRPATHLLMRTAGLFEGAALTIASLLHVAFAGVPPEQVALPLAVGAVFGSLYAIAAIRGR